MKGLESGIGHGRHEGEPADTFGCSDGQSADASEVVATGVCRPPEQAGNAQAAKLSRQLAGRHGGPMAGKGGSGQAVDVELRALHGAQQCLVVGVEEVHAFEGTVAVRHRVVDAFRRALAAAVVVQAGQELEVVLGLRICSLRMAMQQFGLERVGQHFQFATHPVEAVQALGGVGPQERAPAGLVVPGLVAQVFIAEITCTCPGVSPRSARTLATTPALRN